MPEDLHETFLAPIESNPELIQEISSTRRDFAQVLLDLEKAVMPEDVPTIGDLTDQFGEVSAKVSLIGQVKAGKTALANALLGVSDLLPSDVNPWTSVVTSMHVNCNAPKGKKAVFKFFDESDWENLVSESGHIVKMAKRARLDTGVEELTRQIQELKERTEGRLGRNFKMLLGNQHAFSSYNADLIKRYVCLGEEDMSEDREGRFADLTKSADLYLDNDKFGYPITLADTPGINDPFLVREAATLQNLGDSDICVVVLSAHQALSSVDLGLLRLLKSLRSQKLIVFVNRIDELPDPHRQIKEIRTYITNTLRKQKLTGEIPIIFGSAVWADAAIQGSFDVLTDDASESLAALIEARTGELKKGAHDPENIDNLADVSGVSALRAAIDKKVWEEVYRPKIATLANRARRVADRSLVYLAEADKGPKVSANPRGTKTALADLRTGQEKVAEAIDTYREAALEKAKMGMAEAYRTFIRAEKANLSDCLANKRKVVDWAPDTQGLRSALNGVYSEYSAETTSFFNQVNDTVVTCVSSAYDAAIGSGSGIKVAPHPVSEPPMPLSLMRTMSIDMRASSSIEWLRRKLDKSVYLEQFEAIATDDLRHTVNETCQDNIDNYIDLLLSDFMAIFDEHIASVEALSKMDEKSISERLEQSGDTSEGLPARVASLRSANAQLHALEDTPDAPAPVAGRAQ